MSAGLPVQVGVARGGHFLIAPNRTGKVPGVLCDRKVEIKLKGNARVTHM